MTRVRGLIRFGKWSLRRRIDRNGDKGEAEGKRKGE